MDKLNIEKIYQQIVNNVNISVLKSQKPYLHQNGVEFYQKLIQGYKPDPVPSCREMTQTARSQNLAIVETKPCAQ